MVDPVAKPLEALRRRRFIALAAMLAVAVVTVGSAIVVERIASDRQHDVVHDVADRLVESEALIAAVQERAAAGRGYLLSGAPALLDERRRARAEMDARFERLAAKQTPDLDAIAEAIARHDAVSDEAMIRHASDPEGAIDRWESHVLPAQREVIALVEQLATTARQRFVELREASQITARRARAWTLGSGVLVLLVLLWAVRLFLRMERELVRHVRHEQRQEMFQLLEQVPVGIFVVDAAGQPFYANRHAQELLGDHRAEPRSIAELGTAFRVFEIGTEEPYPSDRMPLARALGGEHVEVSDMELRRGDEAIPLHVRGSPVLVDGRVRFAVAAFQDVRELRRLATRDALTGLPNRVAVSDAFTRERLLAERGDYGLALALIDFDRFKRVNDTYGHAAGDDVLVRGSAAIVSAMRRTDLVARWGGEELVVLLAKATLEGATQALEKALDSVRALELVAGERTFRVTFSAGVVLVGKGESLDHAIQRADKALYDAKASGRDRVVAA